MPKRGMAYHTNKSRITREKACRKKVRSVCPMPFKMLVRVTARYKNGQIQARVRRKSLQGKSEKAEGQALSQSEETRWCRKCQATCRPAVVEDTVRQMWSVRFKEASSETDGSSMTDRALDKGRGKENQRKGHAGENAVHGKGLVPRQPKRYKICRNTDGFHALQKGQ